MEFFSSNMQLGLHTDPPMKSQTGLFGTEALHNIPNEFLQELDMYGTQYSPDQNTMPMSGLSPYEMELEEFLTSINDEAQLGALLSEPLSLAPHTDMATIQLDNVTKQSRHKGPREGTTCTIYEKVVSTRKSQPQTFSVDNKLKSPYVIDGMQPLVEFQDKGHEDVGAPQTLLKDDAASNSSSREISLQTHVQAEPNRAGSSCNTHSNEFNAEHSFTSKGRGEMASIIAQKKTQFQENISGQMHWTVSTTSRNGELYPEAKPTPIPKPRLWSTRKDRIIVPVKARHKVTRARNLKANVSTSQPSSPTHKGSLFHQSNTTKQGHLQHQSATTAPPIYPTESPGSKIQGLSAVSTLKKRTCQPYPMLLFAPLVNANITSTNDVQGPADDSWASLPNTSKGKNKLHDLYA